MERFDCPTVAALQHRLLHEPETFAQMLRYFTVQVSAMFRDPPFFRAMRESVLPMLSTYPSVKIWVAGCSTGEELWSYAILLDEAGLLERSLIYGTDINPDALKAAERGVYAADRIPAFSANYREAGGSASLSDYYHVAYGHAAFDPRFRRHIALADHSLATDQVFSEVHLVSCRNVLIYFDRALQDRAIALFADALVDRGYLALGSRETLRFTALADEFDEVVPPQRIYRRRPGGVPVRPAPVDA
jgi:chemotaxis protein methyltransferase CheR